MPTESVREVLQKIRRDRDLTQAQAAALIRRSSGLWTKLESLGPDRRPISDAVFEAIRTGLSLSDAETAQLRRARNLADVSPERLAAERHAEIIGRLTAIERALADLADLPGAFREFLRAIMRSRD
jgi:Helix-turn-helix domain